MANTSQPSREQEPAMILYPAGTIARCNRCDKQFHLTQPKAGSSFEGNKYKIARLADFATCPHCGWMDTHWVDYREWQAAQEAGKDQG